MNADTQTSPALAVYSEFCGRSTVMPRNAGRCEVQIAEVCRGWAESYQHRKRRGQCAPEEKWAPSNGLAVCGSGTTGCHGWIHRNPELAREQGWEVSLYDDPASTSVWLHNPNFYGRRELFLLRDDGDVTSAPDDDPKRESGVAV